MLTQGLCGLRCLENPKWLNAAALEAEANQLQKSLLEYIPSLPWRVGKMKAADLKVEEYLQDIYKHILFRV